jgi:uncharacterized protein YjbI with pentapeptide repeats
VFAVIVVVFNAIITHAGTALSGATLVGTALAGTALVGAVLAGTTLAGTTLVGTTLTGNSVVGTNHPRRHPRAATFSSAAAFSVWAVDGGRADGRMLPRSMS